LTLDWFPLIRRMPLNRAIDFFEPLPPVGVCAKAHQGLCDRAGTNTTVLGKKSSVTPWHGCVKRSRYTFFS
jgi:hypothetical protein